MGPSEVIATQAEVSNLGVQFDYNLNAPAQTGNVPFNGTSAATPNVAGVASLVWSANPNLTATQVQTIMSETAYDLGNPGYDLAYGHGFINADAAVRRAMALV
ncbi:MAG: S8 family serine peptidase [Symploca sp. SIO3E6]|nr:S8 family serine peptidase [Caldora sp. SIO3E6]